MIAPTPPGPSWPRATATKAGVDGNRTHLRICLTDPTTGLKPAAATRRADTPGKVRPSGRNLVDALWRSRRLIVTISVFRRRGKGRHEIVVLARQDRTHVNQQATAL